MMHSKSIGLFGLLNMAYSRSTTKIEKKAEFCVNNSFAVPKELATEAMTTQSVKLTSYRVISRRK